MQVIEDTKKYDTSFNEFVLKVLNNKQYLIDNELNQDFSFLDKLELFSSPVKIDYLKKAFDAPNNENTNILNELMHLLDQEIMTYDEFIGMMINLIS